MFSTSSCLSLFGGIFSGEQGGKEGHVGYCTLHEYVDAKSAGVIRLFSISFSRICKLKKSLLMGVGNKMRNFERTSVTAVVVVAG